MELIEKNAFVPEGINVKEYLSEFHKAFSSKVTPENGSYGITRIDKGNGLEAFRGKTESGHAFMEYYQDGKITMRREALGNGKFLKQSYDDNGNSFLKTIIENGNRQYELAPNTTITKGNFTATTDAYGRTISTKATDIKLKESGDYNPVSKLRDKSYLDGDEVGHGVPDWFGGPNSKENTFAQSWQVNRGEGSKLREVENLAAKLKKEGHSVDYEIKANYGGTKNTRPTSFEPKITVDGQSIELSRPEFTIDGQKYELSSDLSKIYNTPKETTVSKAILNVKESFGNANELGLKSGILAAGVSCAVSSVDNISACVNGEISGEEAAWGIVKDTAIAGGTAYGTVFITTAVSEAMKGSSKALIQEIGGSCLPAAAIAFAVDASGSIIEFAEGKIDEAELVYNLGDSATSVSGGFAGAAAGAKVGAVVGTAVAPGAGTVVGGAVGGIVGGVVGTVVASEVYARAVELGSEYAPIVGQKVEEIVNDTIELVKENVPEKIDEVRLAFNDFAKSCELPFEF